MKPGEILVEFLVARIGKRRRGGVELQERGLRVL
jgi:hypothetical protein